MVVASPRRSEPMTPAAAAVRSRIKSQPIEPPPVGADGTANVWAGSWSPPARASRLSSSEAVRAVVVAAPEPPAAGPDTDVGAGPAGAAGATGAPWSPPLAGAPPVG